MEITSNRLIAQAAARTSTQARNGMGLTRVQTTMVIMCMESQKRLLIDYYLNLTLFLKTE